MTKLTAAILVVSAMTLGAANRVAAYETPEQVAQAYVDAIRSKGMTAVPAFMHPEELERFRQMLVPVLVSDTPIAANLRTALFGPGSTAGSVQSMDSEQFMGGVKAFAQEQMNAMNVNVGRSSILGIVKEGDVVHLVTRNTVGAGPLQLTQLEVVSLQPYRDSWRLLLSGKLEGMARALEARTATPSP